MSLLKLHKVDLVVVGPEEPLVKGLVDFLNDNNIKAFGPSKFASKLEGSKAFVKQLCKLNNIPTLLENKKLGDKVVYHTDPDGITREV